jgi:RNA polymerase sigma-70 factor (ECF subfamily)
MSGLIAIARGILKSEDLARDAVQEALVCLWRETNVPPDLGGWLARTVVHKSLHVARRESRQHRREERAAEERDEHCPLCDPARMFEDAEAVRALDLAIAELSDELRAIFLLRHEHGLEYTAIAARLHVPIGTVRSRLSRARRWLAGRIENDGNSASLSGNDVSKGRGILHS